MLKAKHSDLPYIIDVFQVSSPFRPPAPDQKFPVVFLLDGNLFFPMVAPSALLLGLEELPPMVIVGVGYALPGPPQMAMAELQARRNRDFTPSVDQAFIEQMNAMYAQFGGTYPSYGAPGGAPAFLDFIDKELKPFVAEKYPNANTRDCTIIGDSFGGLFAFHALFTSPRSFSRYVAGSPSLWWNEGEIFKKAAAFKGAQARIFMSMGSLEDETQMKALLRQMDGRLKSIKSPGFDYVFHVFDGETHASVLPATFSRGLREVFKVAGGLKPVVGD